ncbi:MAG: dihydropteroate synthase [Candidatus Omnitrophota bacterium]
MLTLKISKRYELACGEFSLKLSERTHIMGVLNMTPDSFSDGGEFLDKEIAFQRAIELERFGADIIDVGGESTRPGSQGVSVTEELERTIPVVSRISRELSLPVSIDTSKHEVAYEAILAGASIVNDISGLKSDPDMAKVIADSKAAVCVMHMKGSPMNMQIDPTYEDIISEITEGLRESIDIATSAGISPDRIVVDPGIGFGKLIEHNLAIIKELRKFEILEKPILIGTSRKSFIGNTLGRGVKDRIMGTAATCAAAILNGASIVRVHDVSEMVDVARMTDAIKRVGL